MARRDATLRVARELARFGAATAPDGQEGPGRAETGEFHPPTKRGGTVTWQGVHWLTGTCFLAPPTVIEIVSRHMYGLHFEEGETRLWTYRQVAYEVSTKARVLWGGKHTETCVNLPGEACELLGTAGVLELVRELGLKLTRLDIAWDTDLMTPQKVRAAHKRNDVATFATWHDWRENPEGATFYIGKRGSDPDCRLVRFYDRRGPTRVEMELHGKRAQLLWSVLDGAELEDWSARCLAYLVDFVDFRKRSKDPNIARCPRLSWWKDFANGAGRLALPLPRKAPTLEGLEAWVRDQLAPSIALIADYVPDDKKFIRELLEDGRNRRKPHHMAMLNAVQVVSSRIT